MMFRNQSILLLVTVAASTACANSEPQESTLGQVEQGGGVIARQSSDGELVAMRVVDAVRVIEVKEGERCGVPDSQGSMLSCEPGTQCLSASEGSPAACTRGLQAPRQE